MTRRRVDLNCDLGEGVGHDAAILPYITSANIACGAHAGSPAIMRETVQAAARLGVAIGAHPGLPDRENFGRLPMAITAADAYDMVTYQVGALLGFTRAAGLTLQHVKPHGALYNMAAADRVLADGIAAAVRDADPALVLVGLSGSALIDAGVAVGLRTASEVFADRTYQPDGSLTPRTRPDALLTDTDAVVAQAVAMVNHGHVQATTGDRVAVRADSICLHGDGAHAGEFAAALRAGLERADVLIASLH